MMMTRDSFCALGWTALTPSNLERCPGRKFILCLGMDRTDSVIPRKMRREGKTPLGFRPRQAQASRGLPRAVTKKGTGAPIMESVRCASHDDISERRDVQPADSSGPPCRRAVLGAHLPQLLRQVAVDLRGVRPFADARRVRFGLRSAVFFTRWSDAFGRFRRRCDLPCSSHVQTLLCHKVLGLNSTGPLWTHA
jgi:hypothetical protein